MNVYKIFDYRKCSSFGMLVFLIFCIGWFASCDKTTLSIEGAFNIATGIVTIASLFLLALVCAMDQSTPDKSTKLFYVLLWIIVIGAFTDHFVWMYENRPDMGNVTILLVVIDFLASELLVFVIWFYQEALYPSKDINVSRISNYLSIFLLLNIVYIIIGTMSGFIFYINESDKYATGLGQPILLIFPIIVAFLNIYCNIHRDMPNRVRVALTIFNLFPIISVFFVIVLPNYSIEFVALMITMVFMHGTIQMENSLERIRYIKEISEQRQALVEKQTQIMISQIQPHFLYNTLNAIYYLCKKDATKAQKMILRFSDYLRVNLENLKSEKPIPFKNELEHTKTYLEIELVRFGNILNLVYDIKETDFTLPALSLQPLVENAVKYGIRSREDGGTVMISTRREENYIYISVSDDGVGFDPEHLPDDGRLHVGIQNVRSRVETMCGGKLIIESRENDGTTATIILEEKA